MSKSKLFMKSSISGCGGCFEVLNSIVVHEKFPFQSRAFVSTRPQTC